MVQRARLIAAMIGGLALAAHPAIAREKLTGEQQLAKMVAGRVAGKPVDCLPVTETGTMTVIDKTAIVYGWGDIIYVNRPTDADNLSSDDVLIDYPTDDQLCSIDTVQLRDRYTHTYDGFIGLRRFVPYRRVSKPD